jgi:hypothetical protein
MPNIFKDLIGQKFGRLIPIEKVKKPENTKNTGAFWKCRCDCEENKFVIVSAASLKQGHATSCGCYQKEVTRNRVIQPKGVASFNQLYNRYIGQARERGLLFNITKDEFKYFTKQNCYYCGKEPSQVTFAKNKNTNGEYIYNGLDRINPSIGYIIGNIVSCCGECNKGKSDKSEKEFLEWIERIYNFKNKKG